MIEMNPCLNRLKQSFLSVLDYGSVCFVLQEKGAEGPVKELHIKVPFQKEMVDVKPRTMRFRTRTVASYASDREGLPDTPTGISIARFFFAFVQ